MTYHFHGGGGLFLKCLVLVFLFHFLSSKLVFADTFWPRLEENFIAKSSFFDNIASCFEDIFSLLM